MNERAMWILNRAMQTSDWRHGRIAATTVNGGLLLEVGDARVACEWHEQPSVRDTLTFLSDLGFIAGEAGIFNVAPLEKWPLVW